MQTNRSGGQISTKRQRNRGERAPPVTPAEPLILQVTTSKLSLKTASVQALSILSSDDVRELVTCEEIIAKGWDTFVEVGRALAHIRDRRLYRADFDTFEAYCRQKWHYRRAHAYRLIGAAEVMEVLSPVGDIPLPRNEAQVRPLLGLKPDEVRAVWCRAVASAGKKNVTAELVKQATAEVMHYENPKHSDPSSANIPDKVQLIVRQADKLLSNAKQAMKAGDLAKTMILLHDLKETLHIVI